MGPAWAIELPMDNSAKPVRRHRVRVGMLIRVRGMSAEQKFFDEETETLILSGHEVMARIHSLPELDSEIHITSLKNGAAGIFRVSWLGVEPQDGAHDIGLEKMEAEGDLWEMDFPAAAGPEEETLPQCRLECRGCHEKVLSAVPEAEEEFIRQGFRVARPCDHCKATTAWEFAAEESAEAERETGAPAVDLRGKGRAPLRIQLQITRRRFGTPMDEVCHTENVSRTGAYFFSGHRYEVGEFVRVVLPYKEGDLAIPVPARVVRVDKPSSGDYHGVAINLLSGENA